MTTYRVAFTANLYVEAEADTEEAARDIATEIANRHAAALDREVQEIDWFVIHTDDIVSVNEVTDE